MILVANNDVNNNQNNDQNNNETNNNDNSERIYSKDIPVSKTINAPILFFLRYSTASIIS